MLYEVSSTDPTCPLCHKRISNWEMASGKTVVQGQKVIHEACLMDEKYKLQKAP